MNDEKAIFDDFKDQHTITKSSISNSRTTHKRGEKQLK